MLWIAIVLLVVLLDQISKYVILNNIEVGEMIQVIDKFFYITHYKNPGAAWGILKDSTLLFIILIPVISLIVLIFMLKNKNSFLRFSCALILAGAIGNYIDRLIQGKVTDFLLFYIGSYPFPIFNVADIAITCGTILLAIYYIFIYKEPKNSEPKKSSTAERKQEEAAVTGKASDNKVTDKTVIHTDDLGKSENIDTTEVSVNEQIDTNALKESKSIDAAEVKKEDCTDTTEVDRC